MNGKNMIILVVDDNEAGRYATARMLKLAGFGVKEAATGAEALEISGEKPDLVILDIHLPDMNGFEVCRRIKESPDTRTIPVLHLSAIYVDTKSRVTGLDSGADGFLVQPVEPEELVATVNAILRMKRAEEKIKKVVKERDLTIRKLEEALRQIRTLKSLLPICGHCRKIRDDQGYWKKIEEYISEHTGTKFSHGICQECLEKNYPEEWEKMRHDKSVDIRGGSDDQQ